MNEQLKEARNRLADLFMQVDVDVPEDCRTKDLIDAMSDAKSFLDDEASAAEEDTDSLADKVCNQIKRDLGWHEDLVYDFEALHEMVRLVAGTDGRKFLIGYLSDGEAAEEDTEAFDRSFPELSNAAAGLMALKAMQDAEFGSKIADMIMGPFEK